MSERPFCPNSDHDGANVPVDVTIVAHPVSMRGHDGPVRIDARRCNYCAEGYVARLVRDGYRVTVAAVRR